MRISTREELSRYRAESGAMFCLNILRWQQYIVWKRVAEADNLREDNNDNEIEL